MNNDHITANYIDENDNNDNYYFQVYRLEDDGFKIKNFLDGVKFKTPEEANNWIYENYPDEDDYLFMGVMQIPNHISEYWHHPFTAELSSDEFYKHNIKNGINSAINWTKAKKRYQYLKEQGA
jgi:hypothetical protein|tara:strand:- start:28 stop:396 length:369 start_codon:yes stop_codon:yes gene_type:complete